MFCPNCKDEFRSGFTRCAGCDVDLVASLEAAEAAAPGPAAARAVDSSPTPLVIEMVDYCGFLAIDDAREAREHLRGAGIATEIAIRDVPGSPPEGPFEEEYWLRVDVSMARGVAAVLEVADVEDETHG